MTTIATRTVQYPADGLAMIGHLALPAGVDRRPAVLLGPEGLGSATSSAAGPMRSPSWDT